MKESPAPVGPVVEAVRAFRSAAMVVGTIRDIGDVLGVYQLASPVFSAPPHLSGFLEPCESSAKTLKMLRLLVVGADIGFEDGKMTARRQRIRIRCEF